MEGRAWFVRRPRDLEALRALHPLDAERPYRVTGVICLDDMDFGNFITDLYADRPFLEGTESLCGQGEEWSCLLVRCDEKADMKTLMAALTRPLWLSTAAIAVVEIFTRAKQIVVAPNSPGMLTFAVTAVFYYVFNYLVAYTMERLEKAFAYYR